VDVAEWMAWMDLMNRPNKDRLGAYGFMETGCHLSRFSYYLYILFCLVGTGRMDAVES
jgi:hypothetical protein